MGIVYVPFTLESPAPDNTTCVIYSDEYNPNLYPPAVVHVVDPVFNKVTDTCINLFWITDNIFKNIRGYYNI